MTLFWATVGFVGLFGVLAILDYLRDAAYRRSGLLPAAGKAAMADVERLVRSNHRIIAIRCYREIHHVGLAEAKKAVNELQIKG